MTTLLARLLVAIALMLSLGLGFMAAPAVMAQDEAATADDAVDEVQEEVDDVAGQVSDESDDFDDWGLIGLLGLLGLGGLLKKPERNVVANDPTPTRTTPTTRP
ncbi:hypothetical protein BH24CHL4_BH24CHL4_25390 [soil metagenome]